MAALKRCQIPSDRGNIWHYQKYTTRHCQKGDKAVITPFQIATGCYMKNEIEVVHNKVNMQFEVRLDGVVAELVYRLQGNTIYLIHTGVPDPIAGRGIASKLAQYALNFSQAQGYEIVVYCPFVKAYMAKHPDWKNKASS